MNHSSSFRKAMVAAVAAGIALALGACGDGDDNDPGADGATAQQAAENSPRTTPTGDASYPAGGEDVQARMRAADGGLCSSMTADGKTVIKRLARSLGFPPGSCSAAIVTIFGPSKAENADSQPSKILAVKINGNTAIAQMARPKTAPLPFTAVKVGGEWKLANLGDDPSGGQPQ
jgi:hypothetical protein